MAKSGTFRCQLITPEAAVLDEQVSFAALTAHDGEVGLLANRAPLLTKLGIGELRVRSDDDTSRFFIDGGFAQVQDDVLTLLTENAAAADTLSLEEAEAELAEANARVTQKEEDYARVMADQRRAAGKIAAIRSVS